MRSFNWRAMKTAAQGIAGLLLATAPLSAGAAGNNWMSAISNSASLTQLSIPGSHDSCATVEPVSGTAKCQNLNLGDQMNAGVRFLDIRCRHLNNAFVIHHGSVYQNMNFTDVLNYVASFLSSNPNECVIMSVKEEYTASGDTRTFAQTFDAYVAQNPGIWYLGSSIPTLGSVRGKIVLLRRFSGSSEGIDASNWADNTTFSTGNLRVEDYYAVSDNTTKWTAITSLFNEAVSGGSGTLYMTFTSGYQSFLGVPNIPAVSNTINPNLTSYFNSHIGGRFGIIAMDFVDAAHAAQIITTDSNPIANGTYKVINQYSAAALEVLAASTADGATVDQWAYGNAANQRWTFTAQGGGYYELANQNSGKALDNKGWSTQNGGLVDQWTWNGGANQIWQVLPNWDGTYRVLNKYNGLALDVAGSSMANGAAVDQWSYWGGGNQKWYIQAP